MKNNSNKPAADTREKLFAGQWTFIQSAPSMNFLPVEGPVELAFAGRSNVGKSSLINALMNQKGLARTSNTPGRTQALNFFTPENAWSDDDDAPSVALVDMPGYGFAKAPKSNVAAWTKMIRAYLSGRSTLRRVYVLIDSRHGLKPNDLEILGMLDKAAVSYQLVLTKIDKIKTAAIPKLHDQLLEALKSRPAAFPEILATSSEKNIGLDEMRKAMSTAYFQ